MICATGKYPSNDILFHLPEARVLSNPPHLLAWPLSVFLALMLDPQEEKQPANLISKVPEGTKLHQSEDFLMDFSLPSSPLNE